MQPLFDDKEVGLMIGRVLLFNRVMGEFTFVSETDRSLALSSLDPSKSVGDFDLVHIGDGHYSLSWDYEGLGREIRIRPK
jgi:hypothetical protein